MDPTIFEKEWWHSIAHRTLRRMSTPQSMHWAPFLERVYIKPGVQLKADQFPTCLPFVPALNLRFEHPVTFFVGENGSGKSTLIEAIADLVGLPVSGGGRNELADSFGPHPRSELAPYLRASIKRRIPDAYFFRAEFQAHFATLLEARRADPDFLESPYKRYGGRSLHRRSHGEAFLSMFASWLTSGLIIMDEPEAALSPQRQLTLLAQMARLVRMNTVQFIIATHSPILLTFPRATLLSFDERLHPVALEETSHYQLTRDILNHPERYWMELENG